MVPWSATSRLLLRAWCLGARPCGLRPGELLPSGDGELGTREVGVENDFEQVVMDEEEGSKGARCLHLLASVGCKILSPVCTGLLYIGFLSAAIRRMMLEAPTCSLRSARGADVL